MCFIFKVYSKVSLNIFFVLFSDFFFLVKLEMWNCLEESTCD